MKAQTTTLQSLSLVPSTTTVPVETGPINYADKASKAEKWTPTSQAKVTASAKLAWVAAASSDQNREFASVAAARAELAFRQRFSYEVEGMGIVADLRIQSDAQKAARKDLNHDILVAVELDLQAKGYPADVAARMAKEHVKAVEGRVQYHFRALLERSLTADQLAAYGFKHDARLGKSQKLAKEEGPSAQQAETYRAELVKLVGALKVDDTAALLRFAAGIVNRSVGKVVPEHKATRPELDALDTLLAAARAVTDKLRPAPEAPATK